MRYVPHDYQRQITEHQLMVPRQATWAGMGRGKTSSTLTTLDLIQLETARPALVLAPKRVARGVWPREMTKWDHLSGEVSVVIGDAGKRYDALVGGLRRGNASLFTINYDNIPWLTSTLSDAKIPWPFETIVADESTRLKGLRLKQGTARARALSKVAYHSSRFMELTGTPSPNGLLDLWGQVWFLDAGARLGHSFTAFRDRWFRKTEDGFSYEPFEHSAAEIHARLADICLTVEGFKVDEPIVNKILVDLPPGVRLHYREMERRYYTEIEQHGIEAVHGGAKAQKLLQFVSGAVYHDDQRNWVEMHQEKLDALESVIEEAAGMPVLVVYQWKHSLTRLQKRFPQGRVFDDKQSTEDAWNRGEIPVMFVHPQSGGHGSNLQDGSNIMAIFDVDWNLEYHDQVIERIGPVRQKQSGHNRPVYLHYILGENTIDEVVAERLIHKRTVQDVLMEAMKKRNTP